MPCVMLKAILWWQPCGVHACHSCHHSCQCRLQAAAAAAAAAVKRQGQAQSGRMLGMLFAQSKLWWALGQRLQQACNKANCALDNRMNNIIETLTPRMHMCCPLTMQLRSEKGHPPPDAACAQPGHWRRICSSPAIEAKMVWRYLRSHLAGQTW